MIDSYTDVASRLTRASLRSSELRRGWASRRPRCRSGTSASARSAPSPPEAGRRCRRPGTRPCNRSRPGVNPVIGLQARIYKLVFASSYLHYIYIRRQYYDPWRSLVSNGSGRLSIVPPLKPVRNLPFFSWKQFFSASTNNLTYPGGQCELSSPVKLKNSISHLHGILDIRIRILVDLSEEILTKSRNDSGLGVWVVLAHHRVRLPGARLPVREDTHVIAWTTQRTVSA